MKKRLITLLLIVMCLALVLSACQPNGPETSDVELKAITSVLTDSKNNDDVKVSGVVYGKSVQRILCV